jgi:hypothetical protein
MVCVGTHHKAPFGVQDDDVRIRSLKDCSFPRVYVEDLGAETVSVICIMILQTDTSFFLFPIFV